MKRFFFGMLALLPGVLWGAEEFAPLIFNDADPAGTQQGLTDFRSVKGVLSVEMTAAYDPSDAIGGLMPANPALGDPYTQAEFPRLAYRCKDNTHEVLSFAGPLLRVFPGDKVHIKFTNGLSTQRTNLHFHGLSVSPHGANYLGGVGDFVLLPYVEGAAPGDVREYEFNIPRNELPGPFWYHAHAHGTAEMQVACGLSGALYIEGAIPAYLKALKERLEPLITGRNRGNVAVAKQTLSQAESTLPQLPHHLLVLKDFWTPGLGPINGPLEQSVNGKITYTNLTINPIPGSPYVINYGATDQIWEISNQSANLSYVLQFNGTSIGNLGFYVLGRDGIPKKDGLSMQYPDNALMIPPASRATVVVPTSALAGTTVNIITQAVDTQGGDVYFAVGNDTNQNPNPWNLITLAPVGGTAPDGVTPWPQIGLEINQTLSLTSGVEAAAANFTARHPVDATYVLFEPIGAGDAPPQLPDEPTNFSFYRLPDKHGRYPKGPEDAYDNYEPPIARLTPGHPQRWIIQNQSLEWHDFHLHQVHFRVEKFTVIDPRNPTDPEANLDPPQENQGNPFYAVNEPPPSGSGKRVGEPVYSGEVDTVSIPNGLQVWLTVPMTEGPEVNGEFVMHCHILEHEDGGMMANVVSGDFAAETANVPRSVPHLPPLEVASVKFAKPAALQDSAGHDCDADVFRRKDFSLVTFGYTTCAGACPMTVEKCSAALTKLRPAEKDRVEPFFVSLDAERDNPEKLTEYAHDHELTGSWKLLLDKNLAASRAFGAQRMVTKKSDGSVTIRHTTTIYLIDRTMKVRAAFDELDSTDSISRRIEKEMGESTASPDAGGAARPEGDHEPFTKSLSETK